MKKTLFSPLPGFLTIATALALTAAPAASAATKLPSIFGSNMVLQRDKPVSIWGWDNPGQEVVIEIAGQEAKAVAGNDGKWKATLKPLETSRKALTMKVSGSDSKLFKNILVGEVWICSGQSNMAWPVSSANDADLEAAAANFPQIRLISVPQVGTQEAQDDFEGKWDRCTPETVKDFSAVGYFFGRQLHETLDVPIGLIDNAWGGSAAEAWIRRDVLENDPFYEPLLEGWRKTEAGYNHDAVTAKYQESVKAWEAKSKETKEAGEAAPQRPREPRNPLTGNQRPANIYNGVLHPTIGYAIRGAIWYQGESNAGRAWEYRKLFPLMIKHWRDEWGQGDFPFYWVQLADFMDEADEPADSGWAELREAQTMTMSKLPNTGEAVILNLGESADIHPKNKQDVAKRLARWALANDYGMDLVHRSPVYKSMAKHGSKVVLTFDHVGGGLDTFDVNEPIGFAIAGPDRKFVWAEARITGKETAEVWSSAVEDPAAVRYAWANNPVCNVQNREGLFLTPFRTDDWPMVTKPAPKPAPEQEPKAAATNPVPRPANK